MRLKEYIPVLLTVSFVLFFSTGVNAEVSGQCSNCHTMHNSQDGTAVVYELNTGYTGYDTVSTPQNYLLKSDCAGCHSAVGTGTIDGNSTPIVFNTSTPSNPLAGSELLDCWQPARKEVTNRIVRPIPARLLLINRANY